MNFTFIWILDKLGLMPKPEKPKRKPAKKVATKTVRKRRLG